VHGKCSLISKMPGDYWQKFAGLRGFFGYWMAHPGKKLLFMGGEYGQFIEWNFDDSLDWHLVQKYPMHTKMEAYSKALNKFYCDNRPFWQVDFDWNGFEWLSPNDNENSIVAFTRKAENPEDFIIAVCNFTPEVRHDYRIGVPKKGIYVEVFNSDAEEFGGSGVCNEGELYTEDVRWHDREQSLVLIVPPLATVYLRIKGPFLNEARSVRPADKTISVDAMAKEAVTETAMQRPAAEADPARGENLHCRLAKVPAAAETDGMFRQWTNRRAAGKIAGKSIQQNPADRAAEEVARLAVRRRMESKAKKRKRNAK